MMMLMVKLRKSKDDCLAGTDQEYGRPDEEQRNDTYL